MSTPASEPPSPAPGTPPAPGGAQPHRSVRIEQASGRRLWLLTLLALGVVYGDIGTSPLYAVAECFGGAHHVTATVPGNVLGVLSLITWALLITISTQYLAFILRADNRGEGGILALGALVTAGRSGRLRSVLTGLGLLGAAFLYSDGMLTPAISVLSAVEGLQVAAPTLSAYVVPITLAIIVLLFLVQHRGSAGVGVVFGPVMVLYFAVIAVLGFAQIMRSPGILAALSPHHGLRFLLENGWHGYLVLGGVFLVVTGGEALYADLGHFGRRPIRLAWFGLVLPALLVNYFGQGALLLDAPTVEAVQKPFQHLAPDWFRLPLVVLSSAAAVIASQAVIAGTFSLTAQAMQLGWCPRLAVEHTSEQAIGQVYLPTVNWLLMVACLGLVLFFGSASALASAYGVSISITMVVTTALFFFVARDRWRWPLPAVLAVTGLFGVIDLAFLGANLVKIHHGGWFPLAITTVIVLLLTTWSAGRRRLGQHMQASALPLDRFIADLVARPPQRVSGTAVFLSGNPAVTPGALLHNLKHNQVLHEQVVILTVRTEPVPTIDDDERCRVESHAAGVHTVLVRFGFKEDPHLPRALAAQAEIVFHPMKTSYFLGRETILVGRSPGMAAWRRRLFAWMSRNSLNAAAFFSLPPNRVVELGMHVEI